MFEVAARRIPYFGIDAMSVIEMVSKKGFTERLPQPSDTCPAELISLIERSVRFNPNEYVVGGCYGRGRDVSLCLLWVKLTF